MSKLTPFGIALRKMRIDHSLRLQDLADRIGKSVSLISAIETGRKPIPGDFLVDLRRGLSLSEQDMNALRSARDQTAKEVPVGNMPPEDRELMAALARRPDGIPDDVKQLLKTLLLKSSDDELPFSRKRRGVLVPPMSGAAIETVSNVIRDLATRIRGPKVAAPLAIIDIIEFVMPLADPHFVLAVRPKHEMGRDEGLVPIGGHTLILREDVYKAACDNVGRARFTAAHELGHYLLHRSISLARACEPGDPIYRDAEWQADEFASRLIAPTNLLRDGDTPISIQRRFGLSAEAARHIWRKRGQQSRAAAK